jgi:hypothetical protein
MLKQKVEAFCNTVRSNVNNQHRAGAIDVAHTRGLVGRIDSIIKDVRHSPRGKPWEAGTGWRQRRKLTKLDRAVIDSLLAAIACSREGEAVSYEACSKHVSDAGEALRRRSLLVMNT